MAEPGVIRKLSEEVVNRIAAGEIVQRPANALKELIENSLDAKSSNIIITVKAGGLKYLQIQDNGTGIRSDNLDIVCERFTTSKLREYEDLKAICTYGFRGEALASISHIAHLTILTKTAADKCAYKASYENGKLKGPVKPCAGNNGTQITVEDLFYNVIARKKALRSPTEEYAHIMEVVGGYAIHNSHVGFTLKKFGENNDIRTPMKSSVVENVRIIHGNAIARELMEIQVEEPTLKLKLHGFVTNVNYSHKKGAMLLFINHRLVDSQSIRKAVDSVYSTYLPKNAHSFVYLSIELDPKNVDVNVHPTKHEVQFLYEEQIIEKIKSCIEGKLLSCNSTRVMYTQARLPGATIVEEVIKKTADGTKIYANNMVRVQADTQKIDKFFPTVPKQNTINKLLDKSIAEEEDIFQEYDANDDNITKKVDNEIEKDEHMMDTEKITKEVPNIIVEEAPDILENSLISEPNEVINKMPEKWESHTASDKANVTYIDPKESFKTRTFKYERVETKLTSVKQLRLDIENKCNLNLREILANLIFIACIDSHKSLIQHSTKLYLCDTTRLAEELFYETLLYDFQNFGLIKLSNPLPLEELFMLGLSSSDEWNPELGDMREMAQQMTEMLVNKRAMLFEYFSLEMNADGELLALPLLLDGHTPFMGVLPTYLVRLVTEVNWDSEKECFDSFSRQTAIFYSQPNPDTNPEVMKTEHWKQEHVIFPAIRRYFLPPTSFVSNGAILQIASLSDLYKVFERC
ncbi:DNA mismatch repair protein Mlh1 [Pectinophora gossypiella]|uniref:DNA mismatch repair protein Mlh1 n=1 Tax=Pectinophora gossypiella TaxID=13191 RepID=UPI00214E4112|nr:DNA mismatch repair protein Mlh1 [Pectinophora gossypiella]